MDKGRIMTEGNGSQQLTSFPKENLILMHYMLSAWWLHLMYGLGHYVIHPGAIEQVLVMTKNIMTLG